MDNHDYKNENSLDEPGDIEDRHHLDDDLHDEPRRHRRHGPYPV